MVQGESIRHQQNVYKRWIVGTLAFSVLMLALFASITIYIDPLFHFHAPLAGYEYLINVERYQNDGIMRHFEYDSIITGTSMTENFMTSEADRLFQAKFIKVPFSGAPYKEIDQSLRRAYDTGKDIRYVIRCIDYSLLVRDKDYWRDDVSYPLYLYNDNPFDDVNYVLNKDILFHQTLGVIKYTMGGNVTTSFDDYANWNDSVTFGAEAVLATYVSGEAVALPQTLSEEEGTMVIENSRQNVLELALSHPETEFFLFFPPYSICYWDTLKTNGQVDWRIDAEQLAIEELLKAPNIKLYSFCNNFELVCDLDNYKDQAHYGEWVNSWILEWIKSGEWRLTKDNYLEYLREIRNFYNNYDYSSLRE